MTSYNRHVKSIEEVRNPLEKVNFLILSRRKKKGGGDKYGQCWVEAKHMS